MYNFTKNPKINTTYQVYWINFENRFHSMHFDARFFQRESYDSISSY